MKTNFHQHHQHKSRKIFTTILLVFLSIFLRGQDYYFTTAKNGLNVRADSTLASEKIAKIPFGMMVKKIADTKEELVIDDNGKQIKGKFVKITYDNYPYWISKEKTSLNTEGYVFDGYLKKEGNNGGVVVTPIEEGRYIELSKKASKEIPKPKVIRNLDSIKITLKNRVTWVTELESDAYYRGDILESITTKNGQKLIFNQNSIDFGFSEGHSGYYPEYDILFLEGGHGIDICFSISTGETELTIGNPEYFISSPKNSYRLNGVFGGQECVSYFLQKNENGKFIYFTALDPDWDICTFRAFYWINETSFIYKTANYMNGADHGAELFFMGHITNNSKP